MYHVSTTYDDFEVEADELHVNADYVTLFRGDDKSPIAVISMHHLLAVTVIEKPA